MNNIAKLSIFLLTIFPITKNVAAQQDAGRGTMPARSVEERKLRSEINRDLSRIKSETKEDSAVSNKGIPDERAKSGETGLSGSSGSGTTQHTPNVCALNKELPACKVKKTNGG